MAKFYHKGKKRNYRNYLRLLSLIVIILGGILFLYVFFPVISWQFYFAPVFASQKINVPIPNNNVISPTGVSDLISNAGRTIGTDYTNAYNWYPSTRADGNIKAEYTISIPKLDILNAVVTNKDTDLTKHLVQYNSDSLPPSKGNTVIFGHSTLPQLYDPDNYETIFANLYKLKVGDIITTKVSNVVYKYKIESVTVVNPENTSVLAQNFTDSFLTVVTCTPPGTVWKRLIIKARLEKI